MSISDEKFGDFRSFCQNQNYLKAAKFLYQEVQLNNENTELYFSYGNNVLKETSTWSQAVVFVFLSLMPYDSDLESSTIIGIQDKKLRAYLSQQNLINVLNFTSHISQQFNYSTNVYYKFGFPLQTKGYFDSEKLFDLNKIYVDLDFEILTKGKKLPEEIELGMPYHGMLPIMHIDDLCVIAYLIANGEHKGKIIETYGDDDMKITSNSFNDFMSERFYEMIEIWECETEAMKMLPKQIWNDYQKFRMPAKTT